MKIAFLGNNQLGFEVISWLKKRGEEIVMLGVHPPQRAKLREEIIEVSGCTADAIVEGPDVNADHGRRVLQQSGCELLLSVGFGYLLKSEVLRIPARGCLNLHTGYLPYGRGANPNAWSIVQQAPAGVTLHAIDQGVDTGAILAQQRIEVAWEDTGGTLYAKLTAAAFRLFVETWPEIVKGTIAPRQQSPEGATTHRDRDLATLDHIELDHHYTARELLNILRARTHPPYHGAYFIDQGNRYYLSLTIAKEERT